MLLSVPFLSPAPAGAGLDADLSITKTDSPDPVAVGAELTYTLGVTNGGPDQANNVRVVDQLPDEVTFLNAEPAQDCNHNTVPDEVDCDLGNLPAGGNETVTIKVTVDTAPASGTLENRGSVFSGTSDPNPNNDHVSENTTVSSGAGPGTIPPGHDQFETDPQSTVFNFQDQGQIPADFFGPGSAPFMGRVNFGGVPLETFMGRGVGDTDTIVQRLAPANPPETIPIEIVALNLVSVEPITVTYNGGQKVTHNGGQSTELWEVRAGLSTQRPSQGQMTIYRTGPMGGTFDSQLEVYPLLTFTRFSDGETRALDGGFLQPDQVTLMATHVPWRAGCILPALAVPGLNDGFCPSFTPEGRKGLTVEDAQLADHGVYPAQPAAEHFKCYTLEREPFKKRTVTLNDQFGNRSAKATKRMELCNPVQKGEETLLNDLAHLVCYATAGTDPKKLVAVHNQFGSQRLLVRGARRLCLPSEKGEGKKKVKPIQIPIDHYQCYGVEPQGPRQRLGDLGKVRLKDQFGKERVKVGKPVQLCAPAQKNAELIQHPVHHYVCYAIRDQDVKAKVQVRNQFEKRRVLARKPVLLCVPSLKVVVPA